MTITRTLSFLSLARAPMPRTRLTGRHGPRCARASDSRASGPRKQPRSAWRRRLGHVGAQLRFERRGSWLDQPRPVREENSGHALHAAIQPPYEVRCLWVALDIHLHIGHTERGEDAFGPPTITSPYGGVHHDRRPSPRTHRSLSRSLSHHNIGPQTILPRSFPACLRVRWGPPTGVSRCHWRLPHDHAATWHDPAPPSQKRLGMMRTGAPMLVAMYHQFCGHSVAQTTDEPRERMRSRRGGWDNDRRHRRTDAVVRAAALTTTPSAHAQYDARRLDQELPSEQVILAPITFAAPKPDAIHRRGADHASDQSGGDRAHWCDLSVAYALHSHLRTSHAQRSVTVLLCVLPPLNASNGDTSRSATGCF